MSTFHDDGISNPGDNPSFDEVLARARRREFLRGSLAAGVALAGVPLLSSRSLAQTISPAYTRTPRVGFEPVPVSEADALVVPRGYRAEVLIAWGDPITTAAPAFRYDAGNTADEQALQWGMHNDGMHFFPFDEPRFSLSGGTTPSSRRGLLVSNHEYTDDGLLHPDGMRTWTAEKVRKSQAAHGVSVIEVSFDGSAWRVLRASRYARRITAYTPMAVSGPAAGHRLLRTAADPDGARILGTFNNCAHGYTPWGTYLTCEENFNGYFGWNGARTPSALENRYGLTSSGFGYLWHTVDPRFDLNAHANEPNRHGWIVEIDPFAPASKPVKRTALGRFKHENAELVVATNGKVVVYMGDDERNEYVYKFVSSGTFDAANPTSAANRRLLESGTLYVAKFEAGATAGDKMGTGVWIPLVHGQNGLTVENGFANQGDVVIRARQAADRVGATMMDRPEWVAANPKKAGEVFITMTNNNRRGGVTSNNADGSTVAGSARPPVDEVNPRANNVWGHIVRWNETGGDATATTFAWDIFVMAGQPSILDARAPSGNINANNLFNSPDGLAFDSFGRLWIQTDGNYSNTGDFANMGNNQMFAADPVSKEIRRFLTGPSGCEITGITWTHDRKTMFVNVQHPGEVGNHPRAPKTPGGATFVENDTARQPTLFSTWPTPNTRPRSATVVVRKADGGVIGT
ncbi:MAG: PhoX family phosphatase [Burkholderiales bacterium]|nr:PhoX family phosphatase [Burkholderiales bacterium]